MAHLKAILLIFSFHSLILRSAVVDGAVMTNLRVAISGTGWSCSNYCQWDDINYDNSRRVTSINLRSKSLSGTLTTDLNQLTLLRTLALQSNSLCGDLPSLSNLTSLQEVYLDSNNFTSIPPDFFLGLTSLQTFSIGDNTNISPWQIPIELTQSDSLTTFSASRSNITDTIPDIFDSFPNLQNLRLSYNDLTGPLPKSFANSEIQNL